MTIITTPSGIEVQIPMLRNSERSSFKECAQQWEWAWKDGLVPKGNKADARWFGSGIHLALAEWYQPKGAKNGFVRGPDPRETFETYCKTQVLTMLRESPYFEGNPEAEVEYSDALTLGASMLGDYMEHYDETDPTIEVIFPEYRYTSRIPYNARQLKALVGDMKRPYWMSEERFISIIVGTFDMVFRDQVDGFVKLMDHKTAKQRTSGAHLVKDDQAGTYIAASTDYLRKKGILRPNESVVGMTYNYLKKAKKPADLLLDEQGIKRNKPQKAHYAAALARAGAGVESELAKLPVTSKNGSGLEDIARRLKIVVYGEKSAVQPAPLFWREDVRRSKKNRLKQIARIADDAEMIVRTRAGELPVMKNPGDHCAWCDFRDLCDVDEDQEDVAQFKRDVFVVRDPYADHREGAENSKTTVAADKKVKSNVIPVSFG